MLQQAPYMSENLVLSARDSGKKLNKTALQSKMLSKAMYSAFQKTRFLAIYEAKWGHFNLKYSTLKVLLGA